MEIPKPTQNSSESSGDFNSRKAIIVILAFLFIVWLLWFLFIKSTPEGAEKIVNSGLNAATSTFNISFANNKTKEPEKSLYNGWVKITAAPGVKESYPTKEYIELTVIQKNLSKVDATNWNLVNKAGQNIALGKASSLPAFGKVNASEALKINGGDVLVVSTGRSPIGVSFLMNQCVPYFEQFQDFIPPLPVEDCPPAVYGPIFQGLERECQTFISNVPLCEANVKPLPGNLSASCKTFMDAHMNYNGCVADRKNDSRFYVRKWRIFLGRTSEFWNNDSDIISLYDGEGKIIDAVKY